jgi:hypothetical protein
MWSLTRERKRIDELLHSPILGDLGCVDPVALRSAVDTARRGIPVNLVTLFSALSLETWLWAQSRRNGMIHAAQSAA